MDRQDSNPTPAPHSAAIPAADLYQVARLSSAEEIEYRALWESLQAKNLAADRQYLTRETHSLRIMELFLLVAVAGIGLALIRNLGVVGSLIIFLAATLYSMVANYLSSNANQIRFWNQLLWGMVVPLAVVLGDPFVFGTYQRGYPTSLREYCVGPYFSIVYCMLLLAVSWLLGPRSFSWLNALLAGQLLCGAFILFLIGIVLIPVGLLGMLSLLGLVCAAPFISAMVYLRTARMHYEWAVFSGKNHRRIYLLGFLFFLFAVVLLSLASSRQLVRLVQAVVAYFGVDSLP
jgi:hypothetical protein